MKGQVFIYFLPFISLFFFPEGYKLNYEKARRMGKSHSSFPHSSTPGLGSLARRELMFAFVFIAEEAKRISRHTIGNINQK